MANKSFILRARVEPDVASIVRNKAHSLSLSISEYLRLLMDLDILLSDCPCSDRAIIAIDTGAWKKYLYEYNRAGKNLNIAAHSLGFLKKGKSFISDDAMKRKLSTIEDALAKSEEAYLDTSIIGRDILLGTKLVVPDELLGI